MKDKSRTLIANILGLGISFGCLLFGSDELLYYWSWVMWSFVVFFLAVSLFMNIIFKKFALRLCIEDGEFSLTRWDKLKDELKSVLKPIIWGLVSLALCYLIFERDYRALAVFTLLENASLMVAHLRLRSFYMDEKRKTMYGAASYLIAVQNLMKDNA